MTDGSKPTTAKVNGKLWGTRARDWADIQEGTVRPVFQEVLKQTNVGPQTRYLDVGCGAGMAAAMAADLGANVSGIDASDAMLSIAKERHPAGDFRVSDLETLPFDDNSFDVVTGFNSFQYAANPATALAEARRVTKPGGRVAMMTWGEPEGMEAATLVAFTKPFVPAPPPGTPGPFALSDETVLRKFASDAGLTAEAVFDVDSPWTFPDLETAVRGMTSPGVVVRAAELAGQEVIDAACAKAFTPYRQPDGSYRVGATFRCLLARA